jgi:small GTP-binding protein
MGASATKAKVLVLGLDGAGKTSLNNFLEEGPNNDSPEPSLSFDTTEKKHKGIAFTLYDVSGAKKSRELWKHYYEDADAVVWVVDANDSGRFKESQEALAKAMKDAKMSQDLPVVVLANKCDKKKASSTEDVADELKLADKLGDREYQIFATDCKSGEGVNEALDWMATQIKAMIKARKK